MSGKLAFVEFKEELSTFEDDVADCQVIATLPPAYVSLLNQKVTCYRSTEFFNSNSHQAVIAASTKIIEQINPVFEANDHPLAPHCIERTCIFYLRLYLHYWLSQLELIDNAVKAIKPSVLMIQPSIELSQLEISIDRESSILGEIVCSYAKAHDIDYVESTGKKKSRLLKTAKYRSNKYRFVFELFFLLYRLAVRNRKPLVAPTDTNNMAALMDQVSDTVTDGLTVLLSIQQKSFRCKISDVFSLRTFLFPYLPEHASKRHQDEFVQYWQKVLNKLNTQLDNECDAFYFKGVDLSGVLKAFVNEGLTRGISRLNSQLLAMDRIFKVKKPVACFSQLALGYSYGLGEMCRNNEIPGILISHGSHTAQKAESAYLEWFMHGRTLFNTDFPSVAIQTPFAQQFFEQQNMVSKAINTGPLLFAGKVEGKEAPDVLRKRVFGTNHDKTVLLHAGTPKTWRGFRPWVYETVDEYVQNIVDLINAVEKLQGVYLAIRFRPLPDLSLREFEQLLPTSEVYGIYPSGAFGDYLLASDILVSYSSTTIEEALQNDIPVLQYDPDGKYCHIAGERLLANGASKPSPVYYVGSKQDLYGGLKWLKHEHLDVDGNLDLDWSTYKMPKKNLIEWLGNMGVKAE